MAQPQSSKVSLLSFLKNDKHAIDDNNNNNNSDTKIMLSKRQGRKRQQYCSSWKMILGFFACVYIVVWIVMTQKQYTASTNTNTNNNNNSMTYLTKSNFNFTTTTTTTIKYSTSVGNIPTLETTTTTLSNSTPTATLVIQVRGEMGNHLQKIAHGYGLLWHANTLSTSNDDKKNTNVDSNSNTIGDDVQNNENHLNINLRVRHLKKAKWKVARQDVISCFVNFQNLDYESGHDPTFVKMQKAQGQWFQKLLFLQTKDNNNNNNNDNHDDSTIITSDTIESIYQVRNDTQQEIEKGLLAISKLAKLPMKPYYEYPIVVLGGPMRNVLIDTYYDQYRSLFQFNTKHPSCCAKLPEPDEVVFHFRHFAKELSIEEQQSRGFEEMDPYRVANVLMNHLPRGQKIAMTTRFFNDHDEPVVKEYISAMEQRGFQIRLIANQTGVQDFCFLLHAQQELIGVAKSTYARWAAYLGLAQKVQLYAMNNTGSKEFIQETMQYPWTHSEIQRRIQWNVFPSLSKK